MKKKLKKIPRFKSEDEERKFWATHDGTEYFDVSKSEISDADTFHSNVQPVTIRFSTQQLNMVRKIARAMDVGYQSLIKVWIDERLLQEKSQRRI